MVQKSEILRTLLITCPEPRDRGISRLLEVGEKEVCDENTGLWIAQGIKDFLDAQKDTLIHENEGFVVHDPPSEFSKPVMLSYEPRKWPHADRSWMPRWQRGVKVSHRSWNFGVLSRKGWRIGRLRGIMGGGVGSACVLECLEGESRKVGMIVG